MEISRIRAVLAAFSVAAALLLAACGTAGGDVPIAPTTTSAAAAPTATTPPTPIPTATPQPTPRPTATSTPPPTATPTTTPTPIPQLEFGTWLMPFDMGDTYDPGLRAMGNLSFAGDWAITPFGAWINDGVLTVVDNPDMVFEVVPSTVLKATVSGFATFGKNPDTVTPEGTVKESQDWEIHIEFGGGAYWVEYDHVVDVLIEDGTQVVVGQPLAKATPAAIRHGGPSGDNPIEEFEWGCGIRTSPRLAPSPT